MKSKDSKKIAYILLFCIPLLINVLFVFYYDAFVCDSTDQVEYECTAHTILHNRTIACFGKYAFRPPLYPLLLSGIHALFGDGLTGVYLVHAVIAALSCLIIYAITVLVSGRTSGLIAWALMAFSPGILFFTKQIMRETFLFMLNLLVVLLVLLVRKSGYAIKSRVIAVGCAMGLLALAMPEAIPFMGCWLVLMLFDRVAPAGRRLGAVALAVLFFALTVSPWLVRNYVRVHRVFFTSVSGWALFIGNNPQATGDYMEPVGLIPQQALAAARNEVEVDTLYLKYGRTFIAEHPGKFLALAPKKLAAFVEPSNNAVLDIYDVFFLVLLVLAFIAAIRYPRREYLFFLAPVAMKVILVVVLIGAWRYRMQIYPYLFIFIGASIGTFIQARARPR